MGIASEVGGERLCLSHVHTTHTTLSAQRHGSDMDEEHMRSIIYLYLCLYLCHSDEGVQHHTNGAMPSVIQHYIDAVHADGVWHQPSRPWQCQV